MSSPLLHLVPSPHRFQVLNQRAAVVFYYFTKVTPPLDGESWMSSHFQRGHSGILDIQGILLLSCWSVSAQPIIISVDLNML